MTDPVPDGRHVLLVPDTGAIAETPDDAILYHHRVRLIDAAVNLWAHREIIYTLAERDFRAQYKQAALGALWALLTPVATLVIFVVVFSKAVAKYPTQGIPYPLYVYVGILCWGYFSSSVGTGGNALLSNKALLAKTQFPRECFPLETMLVNALNSLISWIPLVLLFVFYQRVPHWQSVWIPYLMVVEIAFTAGLTLAVSSIIIQMRDLQQVLPIIISLGIFLTPVIWPFSQIPAHYHLANGISINLQAVYGFFNPLGPVINTARQTMLLGHQPSWWPLITASIGAVCYLVFGFRIFKKLEVSFADIA